MKLQSLFNIKAYLVESDAARYVVPPKLRAENPMIANPNPAGRGKEVKFMTAYNAGFGSGGTYDAATRALFKKAIIGHIKKHTDAEASGTRDQPTDATSTIRHGYAPDMLDRGREIQIPKDRPSMPFKTSDDDEYDLTNNPNVDIGHHRSVKYTQSYASHIDPTPYVYSPTDSVEGNLACAKSYALNVTPDLEYGPMQDASLQKTFAAMNEGTVSVLGPLGIRLTEIDIYDGLDEFGLTREKKANAIWRATNTISYRADLFVASSDSVIRENESIVAQQKDKRNQAIASFREEGHADAAVKASAIKQWSMSSGLTDPEDKMKSIAAHEAGHAVYYMCALQKHWVKALTDNNVSQIDALSISEYGGSSYTELFAETTAMIHMGRVKEVPDTILASYHTCIDIATEQRSKLVQTEEPQSSKQDRVRARWTRSMRTLAHLGGNSKTTNQILDNLNSVCSDPDVPKLINRSYVEDQMELVRRWINKPEPPSVSSEHADWERYALKDNTSLEKFVEFDKTWRKYCAGPHYTDDAKMVHESPLIDSHDLKRLNPHATKSHRDQLGTALTLDRVSPEEQSFALEVIQKSIIKNSGKDLYQLSVDDPRFFTSVQSSLKRLAAQSVNPFTKDYFTPEIAERLTFMNRTFDMFYNMAKDKYSPKTESMYRTFAKTIHNL